MQLGCPIKLYVSVLRSSFYVVLMNVLYAKYAFCFLPLCCAGETDHVCLHGFMCVNWMWQEDFHNCLNALPWLVLGTCWKFASLHRLFLCVCFVYAYALCISPWSFVCTFMQHHVLGKADVIGCNRGQMLPCSYGFCWWQHAICFHLLNYLSLLFQGFAFNVCLKLCN